MRELENFIERSVILSRGPSLRAAVDELRAAAVDSTGGFTLEEVERNYILRVFGKPEVYSALRQFFSGYPRPTLNAMMKKMAISRKDSDEREET
jgi:hypothetical protein